MLVFRPNVCAVITNSQCLRVLVFRRLDDTLEHRWQFPQGGLLAGETPENGLRRELEEEIGATQVEILQQLPQLLRYRYPPDVLQKIQQRDPQARHHGQEQTWFLVRLANDERDISLADGSLPEFDAWRWVMPVQAIAEVTPFKREVYQIALRAFFKDAIF